MSENKTYNTKNDFIEYHENIADHLLPCLKDLALMLSRFPGGIEGEGFLLKRNARLFPRPTLPAAFLSAELRLRLLFRAFKGAPVATSLNRDELNTEGLTPQSHHIKNIFKGLSQKDNIPSRFRDMAKNIETARGKMNTIP